MEEEEKEGRTEEEEEEADGQTEKERVREASVKEIQRE